MSGYPMILEGFRPTSEQTSHKGKRLVHVEYLGRCDQYCKLYSYIFLGLVFKMQSIPSHLEREREHSLYRILIYAIEIIK